VSKSDVVFSNLRGDVPAKLRILYDDLKHRNPAIVCCSLSGFGMTGPRSREPGYDYILQGLAGWMSVTGEPEGPPVKSGLSLVDYSGGFVAAISLLAAVHAAKRDGLGTDCDVSLFDTAIGLLTYVGAWHLTEGYSPERTAQSAHPTLVPFQNFATADGWIVVACGKEKFWTRLVDAMELQDWASDPRFGSFTTRASNRAEVVRRLQARFYERSTASWVDLLSSRGIPVAPVNSVEQALRDPQIEARGLTAEVRHPQWPRLRRLVPPVRVGKVGSDQREADLAPALGQDQEWVLKTVAGYDDRKISALRRAGAFGEMSPDA